VQDVLPPLPKRYRPVRLIGDGATGHVYLARDLELGTDVAVKVVRKNLALHRRFRARFTREVALSAQIAHRNLVPVHDFGVLEDGRPFAALAYANHGNLRNLLRQSMDLLTFFDLIEQTCLALAALHSRHLVHQDLKPANILLHSGLEGRMRVWVADLGVADDISELARDARRVGGTPTYMAPEQLQGTPQEVGPWTDLYALGIILYEALCGVRPHDGEGRKQLMEARMLPPPPLAPAPGVEVPEAIHELVMNLLDPEPRQRYDRAADVRRVLSRARQELETSLRLLGRDSEAVDETTESLPTIPVAQALLAERQRVGVGMGLRWNRVPPEALPPRPPTPTGRGGLARASLSLFALRDVPFIAREVPSGVIWQAAREVATLRQPRVVLVVGERGAGKTRLVETLARRLDEGGWMETVRLRYHLPPGIEDGYRGAVRDLLAPWNERSRLDLQGRLARWLARDRDLGLTQVLSESGHLARWCGYLLEGETAPDAALGLTFLYRHLEARAWRGGSCLVLEDVENCEAPGDGLAIAEALLNRSVGERPVLVLATVSAEALKRDDSLRRRVAALQELGAVRLGLTRLTRDETRRMLSEALLLEPRLSAELARRYSGQPLHLSILLRDWAARKHLVPGPGMRFELRPEVELDTLCGDDLESLCRTRLDGAVQSCSDPVAAAEALAVVSLAGEAPPVAVVRKVAETGLDEVLATGILRLEGALVRFDHRDLQRVARRLALSLPDAADLHQRLAEAWLLLGEETGLDVQLAVGVHTLRAGEASKAIKPLRGAVTSLLDQGRARPAVRAAELTMAAADLASGDRPRSPTSTAARRLKVMALLEAEDHREAEELAQSVIDRGGLDRLSEARFELLLGRAQLGLGDPDEARIHIYRAEAGFEALRDNDGRARVAYARGMLARSENDVEMAIRYYEKAHQLTPKETRRGIQVLGGLVAVYLLQERLEEAHARVEELIWAAQATGDTRNIAQANYMSGMVVLTQGEYAKAAKVFDVARALAATSGDARMQLNCLNNLGESARFEGRTDEARELYTKYVQLARARNLVELEAVGELNLALLALTARNYAGADDRARRAAEVLEDRRRHWVWVYVAAIRAACAARRGDREAFRRWWDIARGRGIAQVRSEDLRLALRVMREASAKLGWTQVVAEIDRVARHAR